jgi:hypothetical protein
MLQPTMPPAAVFFLAYPPRQRWVSDVAAYNAAGGRRVFLAYPPRERWVADVVAYNAACGRRVFLHTHLVRGGYAKKISP